MRCCRPITKWTYKQECFRAHFIRLTSALQTRPYYETVTSVRLSVHPVQAHRIRNFTFKGNIPLERVEVRGHMHGPLICDSATHSDWNKSSAKMLTIRQWVLIVWLWDFPKQNWVFHCAKTSCFSNQSRDLERFDAQTPHIVAATSATDLVFRRKQIT